MWPDSMMAILVLLLWLLPYTPPKDIGSPNVAGVKNLETAPPNPADWEYSV